MFPGEKEVHFNNVLLSHTNVVFRPVGGLVAINLLTALDTKKSSVVFLGILNVFICAILKPHEYYAKNLYFKNVFKYERWVQV